MTQTAERINELRAKGRRAAVATLVATTGGAIRRLGDLQIPIGNIIIADERQTICPDRDGRV